MGGGGGRGERVLKPILRARNLGLGSAVVHIHTSYSVRMSDNSGSLIIISNRPTNYFIIIWISDGYSSPQFSYITIGACVVSFKRRE